MSSSLALVGLALTLGAADAPPGVGGKASAGARLARSETELCLASCPTMPAMPTSDWLRSPEGRKINACPMACRMEQPAAASFRELAELATSPRPDPESPLVKAAGKEGPDFLRRLRLALREAEGQRLGPLCTRVRAGLHPADEAVFVTCMGRVASAEADGGLLAAEPSHAPRCAAVFSERDLEWFKRCGALEVRAEIDACVEQAAGPRHQPAPGARERCESDAAERMARAMAPRARP